MQGDRYSYDDFELEQTYIPPYSRNRIAIIEEAIFAGKNDDGEFILHIQKDYPHSNKKKNFKVEVFKGNLDEVYSRQLEDVLEPNNTRRIVRIGYQRIGEYFLSKTSEGTITIKEIQSAITTLRDKSPDDTFVKSICNELEMFIERKMERKELSNMEFQVSDICIPNLTVHFDTNLIIDMIIKQGVGNSISKILKSYSDMFRNDKQLIINCNRENENRISK